MTLVVRPLGPNDPHRLAEVFQAAAWRDKTQARFQRYLEEQSAGLRDTLLAEPEAGDLAGYVTILWQARHPPFRAHGIPEIADLNVVPVRQRQGVGRALIMAAEARIGTNHAVAGIGVGLTAAYGSAQRLYVALGYIPDGSGIAQGGVPIAHGETVAADDTLTMSFIKLLR